MQTVTEPPMQLSSDKFIQQKILFCEFHVAWDELTGMGFGNTRSVETG